MQPQSIFLCCILFVWAIHASFVDPSIPTLNAIPKRATTYTGYQVIRLTNKQTSFMETASIVQSVATAHNLDVWAANAIKGWIDVMIPPELVNSTAALFPGVHYTIHIADVEESIIKSELDRIATRKADEFFTDFQTYGTITAWLMAKQQQHPGRAERFSIGTTYEGNQVYALHLGKEQAKQKPKFLIHCGIHAREWITPPTCCWIIDQMLNEDPVGKDLLDDFEFVIVPVLNVDGYDFSHTSNRLWRKNRQPNPGSTCVGTDLNRNFAYGWSGPGASNNPCSETYYGSAAFSGPEVALIRNLLSQYVNDGCL